MKKALKRLTQKDYYVFAINQLVKKCEDLSLLDLVYKILAKNTPSKAETTSENKE